MRHSIGESAVVHDEEIDQVLGRLVEATTVERSPVREVEPFAVVRVVTVRLAVIGRGLIRQYRFRAVGKRVNAGPDLMKVRFQSIRIARHNGAQRC